MADAGTSGAAHLRWVVVDGGGALAHSIADALGELGAAAVVVPVAGDDAQAAHDGLTRAEDEIGRVDGLVYVPGGGGLT